MNGQISIFEIADKPLKFHEAEWLRGHGFKNIHDEQPEPGLYEWADIECPTKTRQLEYTGDGCIKLGSLAMGTFRAKWWRPIQRKECSYSGHTCNKAELWKIADSLDDLICPHVCCRKCNTRLCGARCNGSEEKVPVNIVGLCDDAQCPKCGRFFMDPMEIDLEYCPNCKCRVDWEPWHRANDE